MAEVQIKTFVEHEGPLIDILELGEEQLVIRVPGRGADRGRVYGIAVDYEHPDGQVINVTELAQADRVHGINE